MIRRGRTDMDYSKKSFEVSVDAFTHKLDMLEMKVEQIERKISSKADEIVILQILEHRRELEEIHKMIQGIDVYIESIEAQLQLLGERQQQISDYQEAMGLRRRKVKMPQSIAPLFF